ncbi:hypothetical protein ASPZODRAFT_69943 [Penicilliopsis zonata CBS 506.65]|uniref:Zn(2)-C6 fungal-type domain-containing protein n=1 Tax=Penicilliopsis zonata CBS 506.65 TaxID=1073090 RepID=A0A1L9SEM3_9EURO|nr:hypothetical protein ASPZODRAFT_69943 [Penicilliopsis zonata CBS 506.65]OJJ45494.1 hypothetical protein ASPZODRAFT_69943 [Penicilliopsis zonata CBS 506.65]
MDITRPRRTGSREYQRAYKACLSCRQRKAKCELSTGPDGLALGPPCARCRREQRRCVFSERRAWERKRTGSSQQISDPNRRHSTTDTVDGDTVYEPIHHDRPRQQSASLASSMMRTVVSSGNDALNILFEAATAHEQDSEPDRLGDQTPDAQASLLGPVSDSPLASYGSSTGVVRRPDTADARRDVLKTWEACQFIRMGWLTAREAVTLIDLFFSNMNPLSPILTDFYADHSNHRWLVTCDQLLCCTVLMISSRYHVLPSAGGQSRNFFIHHRLWQHCQHLVMRLTFGQGKSSKFTIRSIGSIEALLLMSEWHPRSLHFPERDAWDPETNLASHELSTDISADRWVEDIVEPAKRSDQMSWMLLGSALSLANELGVYETEENDRCCAEGYEGYPSDQIRLRRQRVQRLLYVYINQLAWKIGCISPMPQSLSHAILGGQTRRQCQLGHEWLKFMDSWMDLTKLAKSVTDMFFPSAAFARQQLQSGRYVGILDHFRSLLQQWKEKHLQPQLQGKAFYNDLFIEYHFVRLYTHSVGMQAVVERMLTDVDTEKSASMDDMGPLNIDPIDYEYIQEVIDGCGQILHQVFQLGQSGALRFCPVRIYLRATSASIFLMKALSLGTRQAKLRESLDLLDQTIHALRANTIDDVHLSSRFAGLLETHVSRFRRGLLATTSSTNTRNSRIPTRPSSMGPPMLREESNVNSNFGSSHTPLSEHELSNPNIGEIGFLPLNDMEADDWLSLPFDPSMAPFGISSGGQFSAYEGGSLNFIWNLPP